MREKPHLRYTSILFTPNLLVVMCKYLSPRFRIINLHSIEIISTPLDGFWTSRNVFNDEFTTDDIDREGSTKVGRPRRLIPGVSKARVWPGERGTVCERPLGKRCNCVVVRHINGCWTHDPVSNHSGSPTIRCSVQAFDAILLVKVNGLIWDTSQGMGE